MEVAARLGFVSLEEKEKTLTTSDSVGRLMNGLYRSLKRKLLEETT
jgi:hypothetical protein